MNKIKKFVSRVLRDIFNDEDKKELIEIMTTSLEEKIDDLVEQGKTMEEAMKKSFSEFGNTDDVLQGFPDTQKLKENLVKKRRNQLMFASAAYLIITGLAIYINLEFFPEYNWFIIVAIALLFWPLVMLYHFFGARRQF
ncbi:MAG: hypothetical protein JEZ05_10460 [Tenericutes bacterium]|nr:hypothetical protein [Mycoplasmatota bacterium]